MALPEGPLVPIMERRWSWEAEQGNVQFYLPKNSDLNVMKDGKRGESFVKRVATLACSVCAESDVALDVGANEGFYAMLAAAHGCSVYAFELQEGCAQPFEVARSHNANVLNSTVFAPHRVRFITRPLSTDTSALTQMSAPGVCGHMARLPIANKSTHARAVRTSRARTAIGRAVVRALLAGYRSIALVKVDVEGAELKVLDALFPVLSSIQHLIVEVTPSIWHKSGVTGQKDGFVRIAALLSGKARFGAARTSTGCTFERASQLQQHLSRRTWSHNVFLYREAQIDIWFARDAALLHQASKRITGYLGRSNSEALYPDEEKNLTCPDPGAKYLHPHKYSSATDAEKARVVICRQVCGNHPKAFL